MTAGEGGHDRPGFGVVMAGGRGTRFWPLSRVARPKQLLPLASSRTLLRETCERLLPLVGAERLLVVTNAAQATASAAELPELPPGRVVAEPVGRNTAACAVLGAMLAERLAGAGPIAFVPADHCIPDPESFRGQLAAAFAHAGATGDAVTFGVPPTRPETGYGYLETGADGAAADGALPGLRFVEKPDAATAARYVADGRFLWNSGIFVWESRAFAAAVDRHLPGLRERLAPAAAAFGTDAFPSALAAGYAECPSVSLDCGVMEKLPRFTVYRAGFRWSDLGSWNAWGELASALPGGNRGAAQLFPVDSTRNVVYAPGKAVALVGVEDLVVVDAGDALLVCRAGDAQRLRDVIALLEDEQRTDLL
jgi:mannose-1-phosphate guanylyltransferase